MALYASACSQAKKRVLKGTIPRNAGPESLDGQDSRSVLRMVLMQSDCYNIYFMPINRLSQIANISSQSTCLPVTKLSFAANPTANA